MNHSTPSTPGQRSDSRDVIELEARLREAEETIEAIRNGDVDAVVVGGPGGQQVYTLENADRPYRVLIEQMQEAAVTFSSDGTVLYCNQRFATLVANPRENIIGETISRFFRGAEREIFCRLLARQLGTGVTAEFNLWTESGIQVPVNISLVELAADEGMPRVICAVITDLTENRKRSDELSAANQRLASEIQERQRAEDSLQIALEAAGMGSWDLDLATDSARRSPRHDQIFGHSQLLPRWGVKEALKDFLEEDRDAVADAFAQAPITGLIEFERRIKRSNDGEVRWVHVKGQTYYDAVNPVRIAGVVADVTDRHLVEDQLRQAQKMEAIGQLTGGIAHDFNNLLMIIGGSLDLLSRRIPSESKTNALIEAARQGVLRGSKLNQQLLAFARRQDLRAEVVSIDDLIPAFEHLVDRAVGETITVKFERSPAGWLCLTDPHQLETAVLNLAINARDAMPEGGALSIATANRAVNEHDAAKWGGNSGDYVVLSVEDNGTGMTPEVSSRVFEPFYTTKALGKGTGLGLSQVYGFAKQSDGFVTVESELGKGTIISIYLPRTQAAKTIGTVAKDQVREIQGQGIVLVVEDDTQVRATTCAMLRDLGYTIREADSGRSAMAFLKRGETVDLVFTDIIMPDGMSGIDLARDLAILHPDLPILLTSGYTAQRIVPAGFADELQLLRKPYTQADLSQAVNFVMRTPHRSMANDKSS